MQYPTIYYGYTIRLPATYITSWIPPSQYIHPPLHPAHVQNIHRISTIVGLCLTALAIGLIAMIVFGIQPKTALKVACCVAVCSEVCNRM